MELYNELASVTNFDNTHFMEEKDNIERDLKLVDEASTLEHATYIGYKWHLMCLKPETSRMSIS